MAVLGVVFERHGGFPDTEWGHPAPTRIRPTTAARVHATSSRKAFFDAAIFDERFNTIERVLG
jgi:hypothetical protein